MRLFLEGEETTEGHGFNEGFVCCCFSVFFWGRWVAFRLLGFRFFVGVFGFCWLFRLWLFAFFAFPVPLWQVAFCFCGSLLRLFWLRCFSSSASPVPLWQVFFIFIFRLGQDEKHKNKQTNKRPKSRPGSYCQEVAYSWTDSPPPPSPSPKTSARLQRNQW